jgi:hypothetical protein
MSAFQYSPLDSIFSTLDDNELRSPVDPAFGLVLRLLECRNCFRTRKWETKKTLGVKVGKGTNLVRS